MSGVEQQSDSARPDGYRPQLDGIRALAVTIVILFHLGYEFMPGGFIGVDVFFVLSGYLITGLLVNDVTHHGRVRLSRFYARRIRRLLPASVCVLVATYLTGRWLLNPVQQHSLGLDVVFSALYSANWRFAYAGGEYFQAGDVPSALVHYWSLGVEEQFYLVWPILCAFVVFVVARRKPGRRLDLLLGAIAFLAIISAVIGVAFADRSVAYYATYIRAYELLAGGALAVVIRRFPINIPDRVGTRWPATGLAAASVAVLIWYAHTIRDATGYPGWDGIGVTIATVCLIIAVDLVPSASVGTRLFASRPAAALGRVSYSLYIWHWPIVVFLPLVAARFGDHLDWLALRPVMIVVVFIVALTSYRLIEQKFRFQFFQTTRTFPVIGVGLACSLLVAVGVFVTSRPDAYAKRMLHVANSFVPGGQCPYGENEWKQWGMRPCVLRKGTGPVIALVGDSHAQQWRPAMEVIADRYDATLVLATYSSCPANDFLAYHLNEEGRPEIKRYCSKWRHEVFPRVVSEYDPDVIFVETRSYVSSIMNGTTQVATHDPAHLGLWRDSWDWTFDTLGSGHGQLVVSTIDPTLPVDVPACLLEHPKGTHACDFPLAVDDFLPPYNRALATKAARYGVSVINPTSFVCPDGRCPAIMDGLVVHRDNDHLAVKFVKHHVQDLLDQFTAAGVDFNRSG